MEPTKRNDEELVPGEEPVVEEPEPVPSQPSIDEDEYFRLKHLYESGVGSDDDAEAWQYWRRVVNPYS